MKGRAGSFGKYLFKISKAINSMVAPTQNGVTFLLMTFTFINGGGFFLQRGNILCSQAAEKDVSEV